ncbi:MAG: Gldg family protein [Halioglobus sp.]
MVQLPTQNFDPTAFRLALDAGLKRFATGFTKIVALSLPQIDPQMAQYQIGGPTFSTLEKAVTREYGIRPEDLSDGSVAPDADILAVVAPRQLDQKSIFAIDQFLMRGGTVILATSPFTAELSGGKLRLRDWDSNLQQWLAHNGLDIRKTLVLDKQNARLPAPIARQSGDYEFRDVQMIDYPYFIDLRPPGLAADHPVTGNLPQVTMAWASPIVVEPDPARRVSVLLESSPDSWLRKSMNIMPSLDADGHSNLVAPTPDRNSANAAPVTARRTLGVAVQGRFNSFFTDTASPWDPSDIHSAPTKPGLTAPDASVIARSPESARIVLYSSNDFMDDQILNSIVAGSGTQYLGPLQLFMNTLDWGLQDEQLLDIRSRGHFNRSLSPMERQTQLLIEYFNYGLALLWLLLLALVNWLQSLLHRRHYRQGLLL